MTLSHEEEGILTCLGYMIMKWNYVEYCSRQILRRYVKENSIDDPGHLKLSASQAVSIETQLRQTALPVWKGEGEPYLEALINAYEVARGYRNYYVHGLYGTASTGPGQSAFAILIPAKPSSNKIPLPAHQAISSIRPIAEHLHDLGVYAQSVMVGFDEQGRRALNGDGTPVLQELPKIVTPLSPCQYPTT